MLKGYDDTNYLDPFNGYDTHELFVIWKAIIGDFARWMNVLKPEIFVIIINEFLLWNFHFKLKQLLGSFLAFII